MYANETSFFGNTDSFMTVRHLVLRGSNFQIGQHLGQIAIERYGKSLDDYKANPLYARARRLYFQRNYPIHWERLRGVAAALGLEPDDDRYDLTNLLFNVDMPPQTLGCSVVYYPPSTTANSAGYLSRNYDFSVGSMADAMRIPLPPKVKAQMRPVMCEPYIMAWYPEDGGYASLAIHAFDLLSGTLDGINSEGLVVSIMADEEALAALGPELELHPVSSQVVGLHELQVMRWLLDTCATAEEAKEALLTVKQYYVFVPCHYIIADKAGHSFVYENSTGRNTQYVIDGNGKPQVVTNFQLHKHSTPEQMPDSTLTFETNAFWRYQTLLNRVSHHQQRLTADDLKTNNASVNIMRMLETMSENPTQKGIAAGVDSRTLWHSLYDQKNGTAEFSFYLGEDVHDGIRTERRSDYLKFALEQSTI
jgi:hypothetical protein